MLSSAQISYLFFLRCFKSDFDAVKSKFGLVILNRKYYQVLKPEMDFNMNNMIYVALCMYMHTEKTTFTYKDNYCKALHKYK